MKKMMLALAFCVSSTVAYVAFAEEAKPADAKPAASDCESKAVSKDGKPLAGAAKASFIKKCEKDNKPASDCESKALSKDGKPLAGAAKASFIKKCEKDSKAAK